MTDILLISRCPPYPIHLGDRLIIWHLARELAQRGHAIDLLAYANEPSDWDGQEHYANFFRRVQLVDEPRRTPVDYLRRALLPGARFFPRRPEDAWSPAMWRAITSQLAARHYDIVHLFGGVQVYEFFAALDDQPAIITPYESYSLYLKRLQTAQTSPLARLIVAAQRAIARRYERWMFTPYACTVVIAQPDQAELCAINPALNTEVIPNGIDPDAFPPQEAPRQKAMLLFVGNYEYAPNLDAARVLAQQVFPQVRASLPEAELWLVGNGPPPELQAFDGDGIHVTGRVPDVHPYLAQATVFVCPLRFGAGLKNKVLEALAAGLPVVGSPVSFDGIDAVHGQDALMVDVGEMASAVVDLLAQPDDQARLSAGGRRLVLARYSWSQVADRYEALYAQVQDESTHIE